MEDTEDIVADMVDTVVDMVDTEARGKQRLRLTVDMEDTEDIVVDMVAMDMEADTTDKQLFHQFNNVRVLDTNRFHILD